MLIGLPKGDGGLVFSICFICIYLFLFYFHLFYNTHQVLAGLPHGGLLNLFHFSLVYLYNTHQVLIGLPHGVSGLAIFFNLF